MYRVSNKAILSAGADKAAQESIGRAFMMARVYFDFHDANGILKDDAGEELPSAVIARKAAIETVGRAVKDLTFRHSDGRVVIEVRDGEGPVLRVSAIVETTSLKSSTEPQQAGALAPSRRVGDSSV